MTCYRGQRKKENAKRDLNVTLLAHQVDHGLQMIRLRKQVDQMHLRDAVAAAASKTTRSRASVAGSHET